jgi:molybdate transport system regulatory protein
MKLKIRLHTGGEIAVGPGKAELLKHVDETGSISEAARRMKMSYMRAWNLIQTMNRCYREPVVATERGGQRRGGASLTPTGSALLKLYVQMEAECLAATQHSREAIEKLLADEP